MHMAKRSSLGSQSHSRDSYDRSSHTTGVWSHVPEFPDDENYFGDDNDSIFNKSISAMGRSYSSNGNSIDSDVFVSAVSMLPEEEDSDDVDQVAPTRGQRSKKLPTRTNRRHSTYYSATDVNPPILHSDESLENVKRHTLASRYIQNRMNSLSIGETKGSSVDIYPKTTPTLTTSHKRSSQQLNPRSSGENERNEEKGRVEATASQANQRKSSEGEPKMSKTFRPSIVQIFRRTAKKITNKQGKVKDST